MNTKTHRTEYLSESMLTLNKLLAEGKLHGFSRPFSAKGLTVFDRMGKFVAEVSTYEVATQIAKALNSFITEDKSVAEGSMSMPKLPRRHFFDTWGEKGNGIAYTDNTHWWKIINGKIVDFTNSYEGTKEWKREFVARQKQGVAEAKSPQEFMSQITKVDPSILDKKKDSPYYMAGKMLDRHADKLGRDDMDFADFKRHAALLMGSPEDNMKSAKQVRNLDTAASDVILDNVWEYSATQKDADTYYKVSGFRRIR